MWQRPIELLVADAAFLIETVGSFSIIEIKAFLVSILFWLKERGFSCVEALKLSFSKAATAELIEWVLGAL